MSAPVVLLWLPWEVGEHSHESAAFNWVSRLHTLINQCIAHSHAPLHVEGASALFDEYLPSQPDATGLLQKLISAGGLWVGPWYARPCETLSSGETLIRNLLLGTRLAKTIGLDTHSCFLFPAPIHINQMPYILSQFGIELAAAPLHPSLWQLSESTPRAWRWQAHNSSAIALMPVPITCKSSQVTESPADLSIQNNIATLCSVAQLSLYSLPHFGTLPTSLEKLCGDETLQAAPKVTGELLATQHENGANQLGCKTWWNLDFPTYTASYTSTWPHLRITSWDAQSLLERWAEPWAALAWLSGHSYPEHFLAKAWRHVLLNQRTDASGGCTQASTYRHMLVRAERAQHLAEAICRASLAAVISHQLAPNAEPISQNSNIRPLPDRTETAGEPEPDSAATYLWIANPLGWERNEVICSDIMLPAGTQHIELLSANGQLVPYQLHHADPAAVQAIRGGNPERRFTLSFRTGDTPSTGFTRLQARPAAHRPFFLGESIAAGNTLENKFLRVTVRPSGALRIEDKRTGRVYDNCNVFEDGGDAGTFAAFAPPEQDKLITTYAAHAHVSIVENGVMVGAIQIQHELAVPSELHPYRDRRSEQKVICDIVSLITLRQGSDRVEVHTQVINRAQDHRLRVLFSSGIAASTCHVAQPFDVVERATGIVERGGVTPERETMPKLEFVDISDERHGLMVASRGIYEYEVKPTPAGTIALTLFRAIGPAESETPAVSQVLETLNFYYCLIPHAGNWEGSLRSAWDFCFPLRAFTAHELSLPSTVAGPAQIGLVTLEPDELLLSAVKRSEDGKALVVRAYNPTSHTLSGCLHTQWPLSAAWLAKLNEEPHASIALTDPCQVPLTCKAHDILTIRLAFIEKPTSSAS